MSHLVGDPQPVQKVTIVSRGRALSYTLNTPQEDRYLHTKEEFIDLMKVMLAGRAAEQIVFGAVTNGAANDLERVTELARSMIFEFGMGEEVASRTVRADNYALSEHTKQFATRSRLVSPISPSQRRFACSEAPAHTRHAGAHPARRRRSCARSSSGSRRDRARVRLLGQGRHAPHPPASRARLGLLLAPR